MRVSRNRTTAMSGAILSLALIGSACGSSSGDQSDAVASETVSSEPESTVADSTPAGSSDGVVEPVAVFDRLSTEDEPCGNGIMDVDGSAEFAVTDGVMRRLDLVTGEVSEHGSAPAGCGFWLGNEDTNRRYFAQDDLVTYAFGTYDGPWDTEIVLEEPGNPMSRSLDANRIVVVSSPDGQEPYTSAFLLDATTGERVGPAVGGFFLNGRAYLGTATSPDGSMIAISSIGVDEPFDGGGVFVLDAVTGEEIFQLDLGDPFPIVDWADDNELVVADYARLVTIDVTSQEVVATVDTGGTFELQNLTIGARPDGLIVVANQERVQLVDRLTGPTGEFIELVDSKGGRIRPDGSYVSLTVDQRVEIYEFPS